jgi:hypothetical protein
VDVLSRHPKIALIVSYWPGTLALNIIFLFSKLSSCIEYIVEAYCLSGGMDLL